MIDRRTVPSRISSAPVVVALALAALAPSSTAAATTPDTAFGNATVLWIAVSPSFERTGLVVASGSGCGRTHCLWRSRDGGNEWALLDADGWKGGRIFITPAADGREVLFAESTDKLQRSTDLGDTWRDVTGPGTPTVFPDYARERTVAVAGSTADDYLLRGGRTERVSGSGGDYADLYFMPSPRFPRSGGFSPALLAAADEDAALPVVLRCDRRLSCSGAAALPGADPNFSFPGMQLFPAGDYAETGAVFARTGRGLYKSVDGGKTFVLLPVGETGASVTATPMFALGPGYAENGDARTAYAAVMQFWTDPAQPASFRTAGGIYRTTDGGATWARVGSPGPFDRGAVAVAVAGNGRVFGAFIEDAAGDPGVACSTDGGETWRGHCPPIGRAGSASKEGPGTRPCPPPCADATSTGSATPGPAVTSSEQAAAAGEERSGGGAAAGIAAGTAVAAIAAIAAGVVVARRRRRRPAG